MNKKTLISSLLITLAFLFLNVQKVSAAIDYNLFNYNYPVSAYYPKSSDKANVMGRIIKIMLEMIIQFPFQWMLLKIQKESSTILG